MPITFLAERLSLTIIQSLFKLFMLDGHPQTSSVLLLNTNHIFI